MQLKDEKNINEIIKNLYENHLKKLEEKIKDFFSNIIDKNDIENIIENLENIIFVDKENSIYELTMQLSILQINAYKEEEESKKVLYFFIYFYYIFNF